MTGPTNVKPAIDVRAGEQFFYNGERFMTIQFVRTSL
jgi:hypothetical protein